MSKQQELKKSAGLTSSASASSSLGDSSITSMIRVRIASHDVHYAGNLVDGAKVLQFFGDVATELLIHFDGDEGLFRAYEKIEFLAPVRAGDYLEITGKILETGKSSRKIEFEARKVIEVIGKSNGGIAESSARALKPSVVVCKAVGTCVTPVEFQRFK